VPQETNKTVDAAAHGDDSGDGGKIAEQLAVVVKENLHRRWRRKDGSGLIDATEITACQN